GASTRLGGAAWDSCSASKAPLTTSSNRSASSAARACSTGGFGGVAGFMIGQWGLVGRGFIGRRQGSTQRLEIQAIECGLLHFVAFERWQLIQRGEPKV